MLSYEIERLVPKFIQADKNGYAMMKAIEAGLDALCAVCAAGIACYNDPDSMPGWRLNEYAWEMGADWYASTADLEERRNQVKNIYSVYRTLGTYTAVKNAVESIFGECTVTEGAQGSYKYDIVVSDPKAASDKVAELRRVANIIQPIRCVLDEVSFVGASNTKTVFSTAAIAGVKVFASSKAARYATVNGTLDKFELDTDTMA